MKRKRAGEGGYIDQSYGLHSKFGCKVKEKRKKRKRKVLELTVGAMSKWKMVEVAPFMWSLRNSITVSGVTSGPWMGTVTCLASMDV